MSKHSRDSIVNVIYHQIKDPIRLCLEHKHYSASTKLIYSGIDAMAYLNMPSYQIDVKKRDFVLWVNHYIKFQGEEILTGLDIYGARCSMLHNHTAYSNLSRRGKCRLIGYTSEMYPPIKYRPDINKELVMVSVPALADAFFEGIDMFLIELFSSEEKKIIIEERLKTFVHSSSRNEMDE